VTDKLTGRIWPPGIVSQGFVPIENKIWVGNAYKSTDELDCMAKCASDEQCKSATFNGPKCDNPYLCVLAYKNSTEQFRIESKDGSNEFLLTSAPRCCHCDCL
jgi:hypothetical protein